MTQPMSLRRATSDDVAVVRDLTLSAYAKWVPLIGREPKPMTANYERAVAAHIIDLCEEGGQVLALVEVIPEAGHLLIENLAVRPDQQGKGLGDRLLTHAEGLARTMGFAETRLYTNAAFASNLLFYSKRGYQEFQRVAVALGTVAVHMRKQLAVAT